MCGLALFQDMSISDAEAQVFKNLMVVTSLRGTDSSGVVGVFKPSFGKEAVKKTVVRSLKKVGHVYNLLEDSAYGSVTANTGGDRTRTVLFGHCRQATRGSKTASNAHPFHCGSITGVHNGTITSGLHIPEGETDSQALFEVINEKGIEGLKGVIGAYALIWFDSKDDTLNILRNSDRTLFYGWMGNSLIASSEKSFLELLSARGNKITGIEPFEPFKHYKISVSSTFKHMKERFEITDYKAILDTPIVIGGSSGHSYGRTFFNRTTYLPTQQSGQKETKEVKDGSKGFHKLLGVGTVVSTDSLRRTLSQGCACCGTVLDEEDWAFFKMNDGILSFVCEECTTTQIVDNTKEFEEMFPGAVLALTRYPNGSEAYDGYSGYY